MRQGRKLLIIFCFYFIVSNKYTDSIVSWFPLFSLYLFDKIPKRNKPMGKRGGSKKPPPNTPRTPNTSTALSSKKGNHNPKSLLKLEHLQNLASWASKDASIPSLAAFYGRHFSSSAEVLGVPIESSSVFQCQRCETILQPGFNCSVRIKKKDQRKAKHRCKKFSALTKNNAVYQCHYCSHFNQKKGTPKGYMKEICPPKSKQPVKSVLQMSANSEEVTNSKNEATFSAISKDTPITDNQKTSFPIMKRDDVMKIDESTLSVISMDTSITSSLATPFPGIMENEIIKIDKTASPAISMDSSFTNSPATPLPSSGNLLLDAKKRKRSRSTKKPEQSETNSPAMDSGKNAGASSKRKRKSWTSLKEIVEKNEHDGSRDIKTLTKPMFV